jgi:glycosyltransferase involved in cell wall biosynthesis
MGGAEHSLLRLMIGVKNKGNTPVLITSSYGQLTELCAKEGIDVYIFNFKRIKRINLLFSIKLLIDFILFLRRVLKKHSVDIIHSNTARTRFYLCLVKYFYSVRTIAHIRDLQFNSFEKFLINKIDKTIAISKAVENRVLSNAKLEHSTKVKLIYNGVEDLSEYKSSVSIHEKYNTKSRSIGVIGRLESWKKQDKFIEAAKILNNTDLSFFIVGGAIKDEHKCFEAKLKQLVIESPVEIIMTGHVDNPFDYMSNFDILVCPSDNEPFGRVIIEAMSMQKAIVASNNGGIKEILSGDLNHQLFTVNDSKSLAYKITEIMSLDREQYEELVTRNYIAYKNKFSLAANIKNTLDLYRSLL